MEFNKAPTNDQILTLAEGVMITTIAQRDSRTATGGSKSATPLTAKTKPCKVSRIGQPTSKYVHYHIIYCACVILSTYLRYIECLALYELKILSIMDSR